MSSISLREDFEEVDAFFLLVDAFSFFFFFLFFFFCMSLLKSVGGDAESNGEGAYLITLGLRLCHNRHPPFSHSFDFGFALVCTTK